QLLRAIGERLAELVDDPELLCRMGGNKFVLVFADPGADADQLEAGERTAAVLKEPFAVGGLSLRMTASVGVAAFPDTGSDVRELLQQAASASRAAKRGGGDEVRVFVPEQRESLNTRLRMGARLRGAVERGELELHYQPLVNTSKREVVGMEALVRWRHADLGLVMPDKFIQLAEDLGMIAAIGRWVLHEACMQARRWLDCGVGEFGMSVNVSGLQMRGEQLLEDIGQALNAARLPARCLELELTETAIMANLEQAVALMQQVRGLGVRWSLDDFGVGQSSMVYLQRLPVSRLKIDQSFVRAMPEDVRATRICRAVIGLAHEFGFSVVAEGVEKAVQLEFLERNGCELAQGYFLSRPVTADAMLAILREPVLRPHEPQTTDGAGRDTVLLVDDEKNVLRALARLLRRDGYRIVTAGTFEEAFEALAEHEVQVVVSDHRMPDGKGTDFLGRVKASYPETVRLILSGYADIDTVTAAINVGAVHRFMTKPWNDDELRDAVREAMRLARAGADRDT
ncbi:MAG TPA: EAL domain-containing protein, partial [Rhodanobacteraceae bacterium]|nr:EAL domain-containing protein [Rhodanobacteraceae bacterium]